MTPEEILEDNEMIAIFIGMTKGRPHDTRWKDCWFDDNVVINGFRNKMLYFNNDWNWIMPVIERIESLGYSTVINYNPRVKQTCCQCYITQETPFKYVVAETASKIEAVYKGVVEFIKWYNTQNK